MQQLAAVPKIEEIWLINWWESAAGEQAREMKKKYGKVGGTMKAKLEGKRKQKRGGGGGGGGLRNILRKPEGVDTG